jgi:hypothetical protein
MSRRALAAVVLSAGLVLALGSCGGGDDCQECVAASGCPSLTKQCPGFTATVQQCSGGASSKSCCTTSAADVDCSTLRAASGVYSVVEGAVYFSASEDACSLHVRIDTQASGWLADARTPAEQKAAIQAGMAEAMPLATRR